MFAERGVGFSTECMLAAASPTSLYVCVFTRQGDEGMTRSLFSLWAFHARDRLFC